MKKSVAEKALSFVFAAAALIYLVFVLKIVLARGDVQLETNAVLLKPFSTFSKYLNGRRTLTSLLMNYIGNIGLFFPFGLLLPAAFKRLSISKVILIGIALTLSVEILQYFMSNGYADIDDVLMNTVGVVLGAVFYFYVLGGRKKTVLSYVLTVLTVICFFLLSLVFIIRLKPEVLPDSLVFQNGRIAGRAADSYDVTAKSYKMSRGEVFVEKNTVKYSDEKQHKEKKDSYFISNTTIFVVYKTDEKSYRLMNTDDMIGEISKNKMSDVKLWLDKNEFCTVVLLEEN